MTSTTTTRNLSFGLDHFGRDLSLKNKNTTMYSLFDRFKGMSWIDITYLVEEEEELVKQSEKEVSETQAPQVTEPALRDVESTAKALKNLDDEGDLNKIFTEKEIS